MIDIFYYDKGLKKGAVKDLDRLKDKLIWVDITSITKKEAELLKNAFSLHPLTAEDLFHSLTRIKVEEFPSYVFCVFFSIRKKKCIELVETDFILGKNFIISNHKKEMPSYSELKGNIDKLENLFKRGNEFVFHALLDAEVDNFFPVIDSIEDSVEDLEEEITRKPAPELALKILKLKRLIVTIRKIAVPQREKIAFLAKKEYKFISRKALPYFRDVYDHSIRVCDLVDNNKESVGNAFEVYLTAVSNSTNDVMKVLSIIATIALPLTVVSSIYGTNFRILPGAENSFGFWAMICFMLLMSSAMIFFFRKKGWF